LIFANAVAIFTIIPAPRSTICGARRARHSESAEVIHFHLAHGIVKIHRDWISVTRDAGVVNQDVDRTESLYRVHIVVTRDVQFDRAQAGVRELRQVRLFARAGKYLMRACFRESERQRAAETATRACHQHRSSFNVHCDSRARVCARPLIHLLKR
jgi:hypothetical protein